MVKRRIVPSLAFAVAFAAACQTDSPLAPVDEVEGPDDPVSPPALSVSDGAHGGNQAVWFLPPLVSNPGDDPEFDEDIFDAELSVTVRVFSCGANVAACPTSAAGIPSVAGSAAVVSGPAYQFDWKTPKNGEGTVYRAFLMVSDVAVGFMDIGLTGKNADGSGFGPGVALRSAGSNAPIKAMIEEADFLGGVGCDVDAMLCEGIVSSNPDEDVLIELEDPDSDQENDLTLFIPAGTQFLDAPGGNVLPDVKFALSPCAQGQEIDADLLKVGPCYTLRTFVDGIQMDVYLQGSQAIVSLCDLNDLDTYVPGTVFSTASQHDLVSIVQFDNGDYYEALSHAAPQGCDAGIAAGPPAPAWARFASSAADRLFGWLSPSRATASATSMMLDTGGGGRTASFKSNFQAVLASQLLPEDVFQIDQAGNYLTGPALVGTLASPSPRVQVVDAAGDPVIGATVRFEVLGSGGNALANGGATAQVTTDAGGWADASWLLADLDNPHQLKVYARGMSGPGTGVYQPPAGTSGNTTSVVFGDDTFCTTHECDSDILAESVVFQADADASVVFDYGADFDAGELAPGQSPPAGFFTNPSTFDFGSGALAMMPTPFGNPVASGTDCSAQVPAVNGNGESSGWTVASDTNPGNSVQLVIRRPFDLPANASNLRVFVAIDNDVRVFINDIEITGSISSGGNHPSANHSTGGHNTAGIDVTGFLRHEGCAALDDIAFQASDGDLNLGGQNVVTVLGRDRGTVAYLNVKVVVDTD